jgi:hypothetical protein
MIDELVKQVSEKTGLAEAQSRQAAEVVVDFLKDRLPSPIAGQIDNLMGGEDGSGITDTISGLTGGIFGGSKE